MTTAAAASGPFAGLRDRRLNAYPDPGPRTLYLGITVLATVILYYELYVQGAVATKIISDLDMSFTYFVAVSDRRQRDGALASLAAGLADRYGRANLVVYGLLITGLLIGFGLPAAGSKGVYLALFAVVSLVEGVVLVATPALIRDFSPQLGRAQAMGFWTLGPGRRQPGRHAGLQQHPRQPPRLALPVPRLRHRRAGRVRHRAVGAARALSRAARPADGEHARPRAGGGARRRAGPGEGAGRALAADAARRTCWRRPSAISLFLLFYYIAVGFFVVFFATVFGYSESRANALANYYWVANADRPRGHRAALGPAARAQAVHGRRRARERGRGGAVRAGATTDASTSYGHFAAHPRRHRGRQRRRLLRLDGGLHRDGRAAQPGGHRDRPGAVGLDHPLGGHGGAVRC